MIRRDTELDTLLFLDGVTFVLDGLCWVKFVVTQVPVSAERPHGLAYSLTLHDEAGDRLLGFDNAHPVREGAGPGAQTRIEYDHKHQDSRVRFYIYRSAADLLADFWAAVDRVMQERGTP